MRVIMQMISLPLSGSAFNITTLTALHMTWYMDILDDADHTEKFKKLD